MVHWRNYKTVYTLLVLVKKYHYMNTKAVISIIIVLVLGLGGFLFLQNKTAEAPIEESSTTDSVAQKTSGASSQPVATNFTVSYTDDGFIPRTLTIAKGGTVTFVNESSKETWPASAIHPTHTVYPDSDIKKCGTSEADVIFDACGGVAPGDSWSFTFDEIGEWKYHDHLHASDTGTIIVE